MSKEELYAKTFQYFLEKANKGDDRAILDVAYCYEFGRFVQKDLALSEEWFQKYHKGCIPSYFEYEWLNNLAREKSNLVKDSLGELYLEVGTEYLYGKNGKKVSYQDAMDYLVKSKKCGIKVPQNMFEECIKGGYAANVAYYLEEAEACLSKEDEAGAARNWHKAVEFGDIDSLEKLSDFYYYRNKYDESERYLLKYVELKNPENKYDILECLYYSIGRDYYENTSPYYYDKRIEQYTKAALWYKKAVDVGSKRGLKMLGKSYKKLGDEEAKGRTCKKMFYYEEALLCGCEANKGMGDCYYFGWGTDPDYNKADEYYLKGVPGLKPFELYDLSYVYLKREKIDKHQTRAVECWQFLANQGRIDVLDELGFAYFLGRGVEKDEQKALEYFKEAIQKHNSYDAGRCWQNTDERRKVIKWFRKLEKEGYSWICRWLRYCYDHNLGVKQL